MKTASLPARRLHLQDGSVEMEASLIWSAALSVIMGGFGFFVREKLGQVKDINDDVKRIERLINITREEIARDYVTQNEVQRITDHIDQRFNKLEAKIDQLIQAGR
jgi:hypothetical protein